MRNRYKKKRESRELTEQESQAKIESENRRKIAERDKSKPQVKSTVSETTFNKGVIEDVEKKVRFIRYIPKDTTSRFILIFMVLFGIATLLYISDLLINKKDYEGYITHYDENLNFSVDIPSKWSVGLPDETSIKDVVTATTGGLTFDTRYSSLTKEVAPLSLVQQDPSGKYPYKRLMVVSMFSAEDTVAYMRNHKTMEEEFKAILQELGHEGIRIEKVEDAYEGQLNGVLLYAKAFFEGKKMYYVHYTENLDKNVLRILYGSSNEIKQPTEIEEFMSTFLIHDTNILEQLMEQGIAPEDLDVPALPSPEDYITGEPPTEDTHEHEDGTIHSGSHEENSEGGSAKPSEEGKNELNLTTNFENEGDIEASETK